MNDLYFYRDKITNDELTKILHETETACNNTAHFVLKEPEINKRHNQLKSLRDAAEVCVSSAIFLATYSPFSTEQIKTCSIVLHECGVICAKHQDPYSKKCAKICLEAYEACNLYIKTHKGGVSYQ